MDPEQATSALAAAHDMDFSLTALFLRATLTVQIVMVLLIAASIWSWAVAISKFMRYGKARRDAAMFENAFWSGQPLDELHERLGDRPRSALERIFVAGMGEWRKSHAPGGKLIAGADQRIGRVMSVAIQREAESLESRLGALATTGSVAPFIGLFGTGWGIKNAFENIAMSQNTNLAVVAPGIAEALLATALGLLAAIPAVVLYNHLSSQADRLVGRMDSFADEFGAILDRQMQRREG
ncbi:MAG: protein TolQ [Rhodobacteraceae bacterium]|nr:protein TolQ [Paracoccaceae bacterium]